MVLLKFDALNAVSSKFAVLKSDPLKSLPSCTTPPFDVPAIKVPVAPVKLAFFTELLLIVVKAKMAPRKSALSYVPEFSLASVKLADLKSAPVRSRFDRSCLRKLHPLKSTPIPRAVQSLLMALAGRNDWANALTQSNTMSIMSQRRGVILVVEFIVCSLYSCTQ